MKTISQVEGEFYITTLRICPASYESRVTSELRVTMWGSVTDMLLRAEYGLINEVC